MTKITLTIFVLGMLVALQIFLSLRENRMLGLIIPGLNILLSIIVSFSFTDVIAAYIGFLVSITFMLLWLYIYAICRHNLKKRNTRNINHMKIRDL